MGKKTYICYMNQNFMLRIFIILLVLSGTLACGARPAASQAEETPRSSVKLFRPAVLPVSIAPEQQYAYMQEHYWDDLDFADTVFIASTDTVHMLRSFDLYVRSFVTENDPAPIVALMHKASESKTMLEYFAMLADRVLHDPNSPMHSDEFYIPVLEALVVSPWLDEWERLAPEHDLRLARQNRVGHPANDFRYTLASGQTSTLYDIRADYTLLFFNNPDCEMCRQIREGLVASPKINELIERGSLKVLALYPDEDLEAWRAHASSMPSTWINAYDRGTRISREGIYDLRAIPSMYLLDGDKRVLAKDVFDVGYIEWMLGD